MEKIIWQKDYEGFESINDIERDMSEMWNDIDGEFLGTITITIIYKEPEKELN